MNLDNPPIPCYNGWIMANDDGNNAITNAILKIDYLQRQIDLLNQRVTEIEHTKLQFMANAKGMGTAKPRDVYNRILLYLTRHGGRTATEIVKACWDPVLRTQGIIKCLTELVADRKVAVKDDVYYAVSEVSNDRTGTHDSGTYNTPV